MDWISVYTLIFYYCLQDNPCKHPVVILKDVNQDDVKALLNFVYQGTVYISEKKLASFLRTAELLQIRGLAGAASTITTDLVSSCNVYYNGKTNLTAVFKESTRTSLEKNAVPPLQQLSTNNNQVEKQDTSSSTIKTEIVQSPNGKVSAKRKKCLPVKLKKHLDDGTEFMVGIIFEKC